MEVRILHASVRRRKIRDKCIGKAGDPEASGEESGHEGDGVRILERLVL